MNYRIEPKDAFTVLGMERAFTLKDGANYTEIPRFWTEFFEAGYGAVVSGQFGVCVDALPNRDSFRYLIADACAPDATVPDGFVKRTLPALTWAVFEGTGAMPLALQNLLRQIFDDWLPSQRHYALNMGYCLERYSPGNPESPGYRFEIWIPVRENA